MSGMNNPCITCGACCAYFRVSFYWGETANSTVPLSEAYTEQLTPFLCCMKGTNQHNPRCIALMGEIGHQVSCQLYAQRPSPCREFAQSGEQGIRHSACDRARAHFGLAPLPIKNPALV
jgi:Fe-S-cluster containining protein